MKIIQDTSVYGFKAKTGLFIPFEDFILLPRLLKSIRMQVQRELDKASSMYERYKGLHESGEASSRQCTAMDKWEDKTRVIERHNNTLIELESILEKKGGKA